MRTKNTPTSLYGGTLLSFEGREFVEEIYQELEKEDLCGMSVGAYEGFLLSFFVRLSKASKIVELGTLYGVSSFYMASAMEEGCIWSLEKDKKRAEKARLFVKKSPYREKIEIVNKEAREALKDLEKKAPFDLIFIDADKGGYLDYLDWAEKNVRKGGLILADNVFLFGHVVGEKTLQKVSANTIRVMKKFNQRLSDTKRYNPLLIPTEEGFFVAEKLF